MFRVLLLTLALLRADAFTTPAPTYATEAPSYATPAPKPECVDRSDWTKYGTSVGCEYVAVDPEARCNALGADGFRAWYACPAACGTRCDDDPTWTAPGGEGCGWIARQSSKCNHIPGAAEYCPAACNVDMACAAPDTYNFAWIQESVGSPTIHTSASNPRPIFAPGSTMYHDTYFYAFCDDDLAPDYSCVGHCFMGAIDYDMCGPGGAKGKGEAMVEQTCVPMRETTYHKNCVIDGSGGVPKETGTEPTGEQGSSIDFSLDTKFGPICLDGSDPSQLGTNNCQHTWQEWWDAAYDYAANHVGRQFDKGFRQSNNGDVFLPHGDANLIKLGFAMSPPDTRFTTIYDQGWFSQVAEDWLPTLCDVTNNTAAIPAEIENQFPEEFVNQFISDGTGQTFDQICGPDGPGGNLAFSGFMDILGSINLFTMTSSNAPDLVASGGPSEVYHAAYAASRYTPEDDIDNAVPDGLVFWPEVNITYECFFDFIPKEYCNREPGPAIFANNNPTSYTFDMPVQIDSVGLGSYDPCVTDGDPAFMGLNESCYHFHQGGPHFRNGQMSAWYPILLDGTPDFFGVCTDAQMSKAKYLPDGNANFPGLNFYNMGTSDSKLFDSLGGLHVMHGKSFGVHFCVDPNNVSSPVVCTLNHFSGFPKLGGIADQMILSPLSFVYEWYTDRANTCEKSMKHYCPYDDYWMTVETEYETVTDTPSETFGTEVNPTSTVTVVRDFTAAMIDCVENGNCDP
mmetsp:Transcript_27573/g.84591  ORF Transcript_27573/g.84591 Transcript_27573/m.84591 type:complete len:738 (-) Transcript_27573:1728-3941(-)